MAGCRPSDLTGPSMQSFSSSSSDIVTLIGAGDQHAVAKPTARAKTAR
jgi:hypothetical protein